MRAHLGRKGLTRRTFAGFALAAVAQPALAKTPAQPRTIALLFDSLISPFWVASLAVMRRHAADRGWTVLEAVSNMDDNRQYQQVQSMVQRGVDGIIMVHTDDKAVIPAIRAANAAHVPMVHFNRPPAPSNTYSVSVAADNRKLMRQTVDALITRARHHGGRYKAVVLLGDLADANGLARRNGIEDGFAAGRGVAEIVARVATEWNADKAFAGLTNALQAHPDINMLVTSSDFMTPQIEQALRAAGKWHRRNEPGHVMIAGFDGDTNGYRQLKDGYFDVDGVQDLDREVSLSFMALEAQWAGQRPAQLLVDPGFIASADTIDLDRSRVWGYQALTNPLRSFGAATNSAAGSAVAPWSAFATVLAAFGAVLLSRNTLMDVGLTMLPLLILVIGQMLVMLLGEIDLSMPAVLALCSIGSASLMVYHMPGVGEPWTSMAGVIFCLLFGLMSGFFNGVCVAWLKMPSFIVTLAVLMLGGGGAVWYASNVSDTISIGGLPAGFLSLGYGKLLGIPIALLAATALSIIVSYGLRKTIYGKWFYAIGHNATAAQIAGVPTKAVKLAAFAGAGACAGLASIIYTSRIETGQPTLGANMLLDIVGAAVIGGISLFGGRGTVIMAIAGATFLSLLDKSLQLLGLSLFLVLAVKGGAILIAASIDAYRRRLGLVSAG